MTVENQRHCFMTKTHRSKEKEEDAVQQMKADD